MPNFLFRRTGAWRFEEIALRAGVAVASDGKARAGMGTDAGDYDGDGRLDLVVTNLDFEMYSLFRGLGGRLFAYATPESGIGPATLPFVGFGVVFFDFDNDMQLDLGVRQRAHHGQRRRSCAPAATHASASCCFATSAPRRFADVTAAAGPGFALEKVEPRPGRRRHRQRWRSGSAGHQQRSDRGPAPQRRRPAANALLVRLVGKQSNRDGIGARLRLTTGTVTQIREVKAGSSYLGQNDLRQHFGLGTNQRVDRLEVRWPSGRSDVVPNVSANQIITIREGDGIVRASPFTR